MTLSRREFLALTAGILMSGSSTSAKTSPLPHGRFGVAGTVLAQNTHPLPDHAVLINAGIIEAVVPAATASDRPILTMPDCFIMPGIINAHCHGVHTATDRKERWLAHGVTSIGDVGAPLNAMKGLAFSPPGTTSTAAFSGPMLSAPGGYPLPVHSPNHALVVESPQAARDAVGLLADRGATLVKLAFEPGPIRAGWPLLDRATASAACDQARAQGMIVRCHVEDVAGLEPALDCGVHVVDHVPHRWTDGCAMKPILHKVNGKLEPVPAYCTMLEHMAREGIVMVPTLDVLSRSPWNGPELFEPVRTFALMGGRIGMGNDYPYRRTDAGMPFNEMSLLAQCGLDNTEIITAGTTVSAAACNFRDKGAIAPGMKADFLILRSNPLDNMSALDRPLHIVKDGVFVVSNDS